MNKEFKHILTIGTVIVISFFVIDLLMGLLGNYLYNKLPDYGGEIVKTNYIVNRMNDKEIVIIGSSRANYHYNPQIIRDSLCINNKEYEVYNAGISGHFLDVNCCYIQCILSRYIPDLIIFDTIDSFFYNTRDIGGLNCLYPYYHSNECVYSYLNDVITDNKIKIQLFFNQYIYNEKIIRLINAISESGEYNDGYLPLYGKMDITKYESDDKISETDEDLVEIFKSTLQLCKKKNVNIIVASSPRFKGSNNVITDSICREYNIPYIDLSHIFDNDPEYFKDDSHLNNNGATIYTKIFSEKLKNLIKEEGITLKYKNSYGCFIK